MAERNSELASKWFGKGGTIPNVGKEILRDAKSFFIDPIMPMVEDTMVSRMPLKEQVQYHKDNPEYGYPNIFSRGNIDRYSDPSHIAFRKAMDQEENRQAGVDPSGPSLREARSTRGEGGRLLDTGMGVLGAADLATPALPLMPLVTKFGKWFHGRKQGQELVDILESGRYTPGDSTVGTVHGQGIHLSRDSTVADKFSYSDDASWGNYDIGEALDAIADMRRPQPRQSGAVAQLKIKGKGRKIQQHDYEDRTKVRGDFEAVGHDMANTIFGDPENGRELFKEYLRIHGKRGLFHRGGLSGDLKNDVVDKIWDKLKNKEPIDLDRGGFAGAEGGLIDNKLLRRTFDKIDDEIKEVQNMKVGKYYSFKQKQNIDLNATDLKAYKANLIRNLKKQKQEAKTSYRLKYARDFGSYLRKSDQADTNFDSLAKDHYFKMYQDKLADDGYTHVLYQNTDPFETGRTQLFSGAVSPEAKTKDTAMVFDIGNIEPSWD